MNSIKLFFIILISTPFFINAQENADINELDGTYTIYIKSLKQNHKELSEDQLLEIETLRKDDEDFETYIGDMKVLIMSRDKMEADFRWPQYSLINK